MMRTDSLLHSGTKPPARSVFRLALGLLLVAACLTFTSSAASAFDSRGAQFIGFKDFSAFEKSAGKTPAETLLTSTQIVSRISWNELVASWNADMPASAWLKVEVRAVFPQGPSKYYTMGLWSSDPDRHPRASVGHQRDADGNVSTDTLSLQRPCDRLQIRLTLGSDDEHKPDLRFLSVCLLDTNAAPPVLPPNRAAWGKTIPVPERSQMSYPNGKVLCSPTTVSMIMTYWSQQLKRPDIDHDVPEIVKALYDSQWHGTGNWSFNMAYAGSYRGVRSCVARMTDVSEVEDWIASGLPVGLSLDYDRLRSKGPGPNGHLVVCVGFTTNGDVIINDPGTSKNVRKTFPRKSLIYAWSYSHNTVYLIYPEDAELPKDRFGHWTP